MQKTLIKKLVRITFKGVPKTPKVRKYERMVEKVLNKYVKEEKIIEKTQLSIALGIPLYITKTGKVKIVKNIYKDNNK